MTFGSSTHFSFAAYMLSVELGHLLSCSQAEHLLLLGHLAVFIIVKMKKITS